MAEAQKNRSATEDVRCICIPSATVGAVANPACPVHGAAARLQEQGRTILRVAGELRGYLEARRAAMIQTPGDDPDALALLRDVKVLEEVGSWLASSVPITLFTASGFIVQEPL